MNMLLNPHIKEIKLRGSVHPTKTDEHALKENNYQRLDLNCNARKEIIASGRINSNYENSYFENDTMLFVKLRLSHGIGTYRESEYPVEVEETAVAVGKS